MVTFIRSEENLRPNLNAFQKYSDLVTKSFIMSVICKKITDIFIYIHLCRNL